MKSESHGWQQPASIHPELSPCYHYGFFMASSQSHNHEVGHEWICSCGKVYVVVEAAGDKSLVPQGVLFQTNIEQREDDLASRVLYLANEIGRETAAFMAHYERSGGEAGGLRMSGEAAALIVETRAMIEHELRKILKDEGENDG